MWVGVRVRVRARVPIWVGVRVNVRFRVTLRVAIGVGVRVRTYVSALGPVVIPTMWYSVSVCVWVCE